MKRQRRSETIGIRLTERERRELEARAEKLGYNSLSEYIRTAIKWVLESERVGTRRI